MMPESQIDQPGLGALRAIVAEVAGRTRGETGSIRADCIAGLTVAIAGVPDAMAAGVLAGVSPVLGLYADMVGPVAGGLLASSARMVVMETSASALVAGQSLRSLDAGQREGALAMMVILAGVLQILFGVLRLGRLVRFVSYSVMTGFLAGVSVVLILSQLPVVSGMSADGSNRVSETLDLLRHAGAADPGSLIVAGVTIATVLIVNGIGPSRFSTLLAIAVATTVAAATGMINVERVHDIGEISRGFPMPALPPLRPAIDVLTGALSVALVVLVQGAGVGQSVPNPDGTRSSASRDFIAQGAANVAAGFFRGIPVGGSVGATALGVASGARRRWASVFAGVWTAVIVIGFPGVIGRVAMPSLGAVLIVAGVASIRLPDVRAVWRAGGASRIAVVATFCATLALPIQWAVGLGVMLSAILYLHGSSSDISVVELRRRPSLFGASSRGISGNRDAIRFCPNQDGSHSVFRGSLGRTSGARGCWGRDA
jgi:SulP family sulfate permease